MDLDLLNADLQKTSDQQSSLKHKRRTRNESTSDRNYNCGKKNTFYII